MNNKQNPKDATVEGVNCKQLLGVPGPFASLYNGNRYEHEMQGLGGEYNPPEQFEYGKDALVAKLKGEGDGQDVEIYECRLPATFFKIKVLSTPDSLGREQDGYEITTGSRMHKLTCEIAKAISEGMIEFHK